MVGGHLVIVAGHTGAGKSMLAGQIARSAASRGVATAVFTLEMSKQEYELRMASAMTGLRLWRAQTEEDEFELQGAHLAIETWPLWCSAQSQIGLGELGAACRRLQAEHGLGLVVVDYLQLMQLAEGRESEATKIGQITRGLKALARELDVCVLLVSQFNNAHAGEMRARDGLKNNCIISQEKYPVPYVEGLKGSGSIGQDADCIVAVQRHVACPVEGWRHHAEIGLIKNRNGPRGSCFALEDFPRCRFDWLTQPEIERFARGDLGLYRALMEDQNLYADEAEPPEAPEPRAPRLHNAYEFDPELERALNIAAAIDPAQRRAQTTGPVERFQYPHAEEGGEDG